MFSFFLNNKKLICIVLLFHLFVCQNTIAQEPKIFIQEVTDKASSILASNIDKKSKMKNLRELAE